MKFPQGRYDVTYPLRRRAWTHCGWKFMEKYSPEEISALVLKKIKNRISEHYSGKRLLKAVITVPAYFNDAQRNATKRAGGVLRRLWILMNSLQRPWLTDLDKQIKKVSRKSPFMILGRDVWYFYSRAEQRCFQVPLPMEIHVWEMISMRRWPMSCADSFVPAEMKCGYWIVGETSRGSGKGKNVFIDGNGAAEVQLFFVRADFLIFSTKITRKELMTLARPIIEKTRQVCSAFAAQRCQIETGRSWMRWLWWRTKPALPLVRASSKKFWQRTKSSGQSRWSSGVGCRSFKLRILSGDIQNMVLLHHAAFLGLFFLMD